jgi:hypothetical protein
MVFSVTPGEQHQALVLLHSGGAGTDLPTGRVAASNSRMISPSRRSIVRPCSNHHTCVAPSG